MPLTEIALEPRNWIWPRDKVAATTFRGRRCVECAADSNFVARARGIEMRDGIVELDLAVARDRSFHGLAFRWSGAHHESFFIRPHQVGNPDAVQYTPVFSGVSAWQLYHGAGYWAPIEFPIERWFRLRVTFAGGRGEAYFDDMATPALVFGGLKAPIVSGAIGIQVGGTGLRVARFAYDDQLPGLLGPPPLRKRSAPGTVPGWWVSAPFGERDDAASASGWQYLGCEPGGLANLARLHPVTPRRNTVVARVTVRAATAGTRTLRFGFSDRATVSLNGTRLYRGDYTYRNRDYRFLGSIGWFDALELPLRRGANELAFTVSESFGGWGLQARVDDPVGLSFDAP